MCALTAGASKGISATGTEVQMLNTLLLLHFCVQLYKHFVQPARWRVKSGPGWIPCVAYWQNPTPIVLDTLNGTFEAYLTWVNGSMFLFLMGQRI